MRHALTPEQIQSLYAFAEDCRNGIDLELVTALNDLHDRVQTSMVRELAAVRRHNKGLQARVDRDEMKRENAVLSGEFAETQLDSADVAAVLLYHLQGLRTYKLSRQKVILILYEMYASWLASKRERLFTEHPVATEYGPMFWRVYKRIDTRVNVPYEKVAQMKAANPGVAVFCENAARKYYDYNDKTLSEMFLKSRPYSDATKEHNGGKWNKEIDDVQIFQWKSGAQKGGR